MCIYKGQRKYQILYQNAFATKFKISKSNVKQIVEDGRACWTVENENNNLLKNRDYNMAKNVKMYFLKDFAFS